MSHSAKGICSCALEEKWLGRAGKWWEKEAACCLSTVGRHLSFFFGFDPRGGHGVHTRQWLPTEHIGSTDTGSSQYRTKLPSPDSKGLWLFHPTTPDLGY